MSAAGSALFAVALGIAAHVLSSDLALAQAADSLVDVAAAMILAWVVRVAAAPGDADHPMGHGRAEPLGALAIAVLAALLAFEVGATAVDTLLGQPAVRPHLALLGVFLGKMVFRGLIYLGARTGGGPALEALTVDARNDALVGLVAIFGFGAARYGAPSVDSWLALPLAVWIGWSGVELARDNIRLLMGEAPSAERQQELLHLAASVSGVLGAHDLRAQHLGTELQVHVHITVPGELTVREGHDIGEGVRLLLESQDDVGHCSVHIDPHAPSLPDVGSRDQTPAALVAPEQPGQP